MPPGPWTQRRWEVYVPLKQFWIIALLDFISIIWPFVSWVSHFLTQSTLW